MKKKTKKDESLYKNLVVDPKNIKREKQPDYGPSNLFHHLDVVSFRAFAEMGFDPAVYDGLFVFIVLQKRPDNMRLMKIPDIEEHGPGHSSMVSKFEYDLMKLGDEDKHQVKYAGELFFKDGLLLWWSTRSGHFWPDGEKRDVFAKHWGLTKVNYWDWISRTIIPPKRILQLVQLSKQKEKTEGGPPDNDERIGVVELGDANPFPAGIMTMIVVLFSIICCIWMICALTVGFGCFFFGKAMRNGFRQKEVQFKNEFDSESVV